MLQETKDVFAAIADLTKLSTEVGPMLSIQLERPLQISLKRTIFIRKGDVVRVEYFGPFGPALVDVDADKCLMATHVILECRGTIYSLCLEVVCENLDTQEIITVKL